MKDLTLSSNVLQFDMCRRWNKAFAAWRQEHEAQKVRDDRKRREEAQLAAFRANHPIKEPPESAA